MKVKLYQPFLCIYCDSHRLLSFILVTLWIVTAGGCIWAYPYIPETRPTWLGQAVFLILGQISFLICHKILLCWEVSHLCSLKNLFIVFLCCSRLLLWGVQQHWPHKMGLKDIFLFSSVQCFDNCHRLFKSSVKFKNEASGEGSLWGTVFSRT